MTTVHFLQAGLALCGKPGFPGDWPEGHVWIALDTAEKADEVNCPDCLVTAEYIRTGIAPPPHPRFPKGKLSPDDEGEIDMAIGIENNTIIIGFRKPVRWLGLDYETAKSMGAALLKRAEEIKPP